MTDLNTNNEDLNLQNNREEEQSNVDVETQSEKEKLDVPKHLRKLYEKEKKEKLAIQAELQKIKEAEAEKNKSLEEKYLEAQKRQEELEKKLQKTSLLSQFEKRLFAENVNSEFSDLISYKAETLLQTEDSIDEVIETLKTTYPSAFIKSAKPMGKIGVSANGSSSTNLPSREQVLRDLEDPYKPLTKEGLELQKQLKL